MASMGLSLFLFLATLLLVRAVPDVLNPAQINLRGILTPADPEAKNTNFYAHINFQYDLNNAFVAPTLSFLFQDAPGVGTTQLIASVWGGASGTPYELLFLYNVDTSRITELYVEFFVLNNYVLHGEIFVTLSNTNGIVAEGPLRRATAFARRAFLEYTPFHFIGFKPTPPGNGPRFMVKDPNQAYITLDHTGPSAVLFVDLPALNGKDNFTLALLDNQGTAILNLRSGALKSPFMGHLYQFDFNTLVTALRSATYFGVLDVNAAVVWIGNLTDVVPQDSACLPDVVFPSPYIDSYVAACPYGSSLFKFSSLSLPTPTFANHLIRASGVTLSTAVAQNFAAQLLAANDFSFSLVDSVNNPLFPEFRFGVASVKDFNAPDIFYVCRGVWLVYNRNPLPIFFRYGKEKRFLTERGYVEAFSHAFFSLSASRYFYLRLENRPVDSTYYLAAPRHQAQCVEFLHKCPARWTVKPTVNPQVQLSLPVVYRFVNNQNAIPFPYATVSLNVGSFLNETLVSYPNAPIELVDKLEVHLLNKKVHSSAKLLTCA